MLDITILPSIKHLCIVFPQGLSSWQCTGYKLVIHKETTETFGLLTFLPLPYLQQTLLNEKMFSSIIP